jgi:hypothetical protein
MGCKERSHVCTQSMCGAHASGRVADTTQGPRTAARRLCCRRGRASLLTRCIRAHLWHARVSVLQQRHAPAACDRASARARARRFASPPPHGTHLQLCGPVRAQLSRDARRWKPPNGVLLSRRHVARHSCATETPQGPLRPSRFSPIEVRRTRRAPCLIVQPADAARACHAQQIHAARHLPARGGTQPPGLRADGSPPAVRPRRSSSASPRAQVRYTCGFCGRGRGRFGRRRAPAGGTAHASAGAHGHHAPMWWHARRPPRRGASNQRPFSGAPRILSHRNVRFVVLRTPGVHTLAQGSAGDRRRVARWRV